MSEMTVRRSKAKTRQAALAGLVLSLAVIFTSTFLWWRYKMSSLTKYDPALAAFKAHKIPTDEDGRVDLSKTFPGLTGHNDAYISYGDDGNFIVMFPTFYGKGSEVAGVLYTSRPLTESDTHARVSAIHFDQKLIQAGSYANLLLDERINQNWYRVSYRLH